MKKIKILCDDILLSAELYNTPTAHKIANALPIIGRVNHWGAEVYFTIPVDADIESDARDVLEPGELGFWPVGNAFCIFWGATLASIDDKPRAASNVNVFGKVAGDASVLDAVSTGSEIRVELI